MGTKNVYAQKRNQLLFKLFDIVALLKLCKSIIYQGIH